MFESLRRLHAPRGARVRRVNSKARLPKRPGRPPKLSAADQVVLGEMLDILECELEELTTTFEPVGGNDWGWNEVVEVDDTSLFSDRRRRYVIRDVGEACESFYIAGASEGGGRQSFITLTRPLRFRYRAGARIYLAKGTGNPSPQSSLPIWTVEEIQALVKTEFRKSVSTVWVRRYLKRNKAMHIVSSKA